MALSYKNDEQQDERLDPYSDNARQLHDQEQSGYDGEFNDDIAATDDSDQEDSNRAEQSTKNIDEAKEKEADGGWKNNFQSGDNKKEPFSFKAFVKKKGPLGVIVALLGGGIGIGGLLSPSLLLPQMTAIFTNDGSDATPAITARSDIILIKNKMKGLGNTLGICGAKVTIRCKFSTMSDRQLKKFQRAGFEVTSEKKFGRNIVRELKLPMSDGSTRVFKNPGELKAALDDPYIASAIYQVFSPATPFISKYFNKVLAKWKISKANTLAGNTRDKVKESFRTRLGLGGGGAGETRFKGVIDKGKSIAQEANKTTGIELGCLAYNFSQTTITSVKVAKGAALASFALTFFIAADQIRAGDAEPEVISTLATQLTETEQDPNKPEYNLTATDSNGYKTAAYGDVNALPEYSEQYLLGGGALMLALGGALREVNQVAGSKNNVKIACKVARAIGLGGCLLGLQAVAGCVLMVALGIIVLGPLIEKGLEALVKHASDLDLDDNTIGAKAGDAIFVGAGVMLGGMSQGLGMKPSNKADIEEYAAYTDPVRKKQIAVKTYDAQSEPLNIYNQYSFLGSLATKLNLAKFSDSSLSNNLLRTLAIVPSSLPTAANAGASVFMQTNPYNEERYNKCEDEALKSIGVDADISCNPRFSMSPEELAMDPDTNLTFMTGFDENDNKVGEEHVDESGAPKSDEYKKFVEFCGIGRTDPLGETSRTVESGGWIENDEDWYTGKKCLEDSEMMSHFRTFTIDNTVDGMMDDEEPPAAAGPAASGDAKALAQQVADNTNIEFANPATEEQLKIFASGGQVFDSCGKPMTVSKYLLAALQTNSSKYKILINNLGFKQDRSMCESGTKQHPKGTAVDLNRIDNIASGASTGAIDFSPGDLPIVNQYATDFLASLPCNRGGVGQKDHGVNPTFPPCSVALNGSHLFADAGNHLHIDARNRENLSDTE